MTVEQLNTEVPESIEGRIRWGNSMKDRDVVYREMFLWRTDERIADKVTVMITRYPFGEFGYMVSIDGYTRFAMQFYYAEDIPSIALYLQDDTVNIRDNSDMIDLIVFTLKELLHNHFVVDKKTKQLKMSR